MVDEKWLQCQSVSIFDLLDTHTDTKLDKNGFKGIFLMQWTSLFLTLTLGNARYAQL